MATNNNKTQSMTLTINTLNNLTRLLIKHRHSTQTSTIKNTTQSIALNNNTSNTLKWLWIPHRHHTQTSTHNSKTQSAKLRINTLNALKWLLITHGHSTQTSTNNNTTQSIALNTTQFHQRLLLIYHYQSWRDKREAANGRQIEAGKHSTRRRPHYYSQGSHIFSSVHYQYQY